MAWTEEQQQAITSEGKNIIVSAGAGSGKTAVLTARVLRKLQSGVHINELLILTFTNAAAAEMKERIRKTIHQTKGLEEEANLIDSAYITTFDSFSLSMVKKFHTKLNITHNIKITDEVTIDLEKNKILDEIMEEHYLSPTQDFIKLIQDFCLKDDKDLKKELLEIYKKIELKYDKEEYLNDYFEREWTEEKWHTYQKEYFSMLCSYQKEIEQYVMELNDYFDGTYISKIEDVLSKLLASRTYEELKSSLEIKLPAVPKGSSEEGKKVKATISELIKELKSLAIYENEEEMMQELLTTTSNLHMIITILKELDQRLTIYKKENEIYNFTDIARLAIKVVNENSEIRQELTESFNEILVDEYQDTSDTQEKFISLISKNNVYMVGDIKQSIYRFRNANPYIFKNKYDTYRDTDQGIKIDLVKNFRSRKEVLANINLLFNSLMDDEIGGADYEASHQMVFGNTSYVEEGKTEQDYNLEVLTYEESKKNITKEEQEAFIIARDIITKIKNSYQIFDKDEKILRQIEYKDIVILLDKSKNFNLYKKTFEYFHIPLTILKEESLQKDQDILILKNLLKLLLRIKEKNFDEEFKYSFVSVSRSFLFPTSDQEIYEYVAKNSYQESPLYQKCLELVENIEITPSAAYLEYILESFCYEEKLLTIGNVKSFRIRAEYFYNLCQEFSEKGNTIAEFITYLEDIFTGDYDLKFSVNETSRNSCKIMTIHKSKGLEFPICYFAGFSNQFNMSELKEKIIFDNHYGIILPKVQGYYKDTILKTLLKKRVKQEEISERIRLLYVALTRAKEKMIIVLKEQEEQEERMGKVPIYERKKYNSFQAMMKSIYSLLLPYIKKTEVEVDKRYLETISSSAEERLKNEYDDLQVEEAKIDAKELEDIHYSKEKLQLPTKEEQDKMAFGVKIHEMLEQTDFQYLKNQPVHGSIMQKIHAFINSRLIRENMNCKMYKEYEFIYRDGKKQAHGMIDLLIEREDKVIIIDYKLKNIADPSYDQQLNGYRNVIRNKTKKEVECYLYSILEEQFRKVEECD